MRCSLLFPDRSLTDYAFLSSHPDHGIEGFEFRQGKALAERFPAGAAYAMDADYPDRRALYDLQPNGLGVPIVSAAFAACLRDVDAIELLPIRILDHRGKVASDGHCIANPLGFVDCIDADATQGEPDPLQKDRFGSVAKLVLDPSRVPSGARLFRLQRAPDLFAVTDELADRLRASGLRGVDLVAPENYDSALF